MMDSKISLKTLLSVIAAGIMSFSGVVIETSMNITFPTLMHDFNVGTSTVQWMTTIYLLIVSIVVPLSAILNRNFKTKQLFIVANLLFILGVVCDLCAPTFTVLLLGRVIQGFGTGIALPLMFNIILDQVPAEKLGVMMGVGNLITAVAPAVGPTFGGFIVSTIGWRYIFAILLPVLVISLLLGVLNIEQKREIKKTRLDFVGLILIVITFIGLVFGFSNMSSGNILNALVLLPIIVGIIALITLYKHCVNSKNAILDLSVLQNHKFSGHVISFFIIQFITLGLSFILPNYVQLVNHSSAFIAGLLVLPGAIVGALFAPVSGSLYDKFGAYKPIAFGMSFGMIGMILFTIFGTHLSNAMILGFYIIFMLCIGLSFGNIMTSGLSNLNNNQRTDGNAVFNTTQQIAGAIGTSVTSAIITISQLSSGNEETGTAVGSLHALILLLALIVIASLILNSVVKRK
ncbi:DHA2 family efflux MFS transporter permease subunit [Apilactobacillus kunkeei]|nr:DHA2 family efflux MFS transporter permease subunit [Apilactobacillus kunkeei]MBX8456224.1 DHA2 family efflux MFS transporter permease subunit [Apilactobacillus kunkeei]QYU55156.1 DHA2 family efflux MFS transporter permease subunit [Apilactobacillus kunkeei]